MNKVVALITAWSLASVCLVAQPSIVWQNTYGGSGDERVHDALQTADGGYLLVGHTTSSGGQVTGYQGNEDVWVVRTDANGTLLWQRTLGSGASERGLAVAQADDGGFLIAGTAEDNGGDIANIIGDGDIWLVKLNGNGTVLWENTYGGTGFDEPRAVVAVDDGFVVAGFTESDDVQVTGYQGSGDLWVFKVNGTGTLQWQRTIGGTNRDEAHGMRRTAENGVIIAGSTQSNNGDLTQNFGGTDAWLVKLAGNGTIQWHQVYGHTGDERAMDVVQRADGGYAFAASTNSQGGQVSQNFGNYDFWLVRTNPKGVLEGQVSYGGSGDDMVHALQLTSDGGYVMAGYSVSDNGTVTNPLGGFDFWAVRTDASGLLQWQRNLGGSDDDISHAVLQTSDGGYLLAGLTNSEDQDVTNARGGEDFWAVKLQGGSVGVDEQVTLNAQLILFPVPLNDAATLVLDLKQPSPVTLRVLDAVGRTVKVQDLGRQQAGEQRIVLDMAGSPEGTYSLVIDLGSSRMQRSFVIGR